MGWRSYAWFVLPCLVGCATVGGHVPVIVLDGDVVAVQRLQPDVVARACTTNILGIATRDTGTELERALREIAAAGNEEGNVLVDVAITWTWFATGIYNRRCVEVHGDLGRQVSTVRLPGHAGHH